MGLDEAIEELRDLAESPSITALSSASRVVLAELEKLRERVADLEFLTGVSDREARAQEEY